MISCHLGSGASIAAIEYGRSVETSMGMTPLEGLVMGTRAGDLDPGVLLDSARELTPDALEDLLNKRSGLAGLTGTGDLRDIERRAARRRRTLPAGHQPLHTPHPQIHRRVRRRDGRRGRIAFTGGVGEHSALMRHRCLQRLDFSAPSSTKNAIATRGSARNARLSMWRREDSRVRLLVVRADEELAMAATRRSCSHARRDPAACRAFPIAVSARHAHLSQATIDRLFGPGYQLQPKTALSQTGQFSAQETVRLIGPRGSLDHVRLMGPPRAHDQVEISRSDEFVLGIDAPVRISGDLANTPGATLEGPRGRITISARRDLRAAPHPHGPGRCRAGWASPIATPCRCESIARVAT